VQEWLRDGITKFQIIGTGRDSTGIRLRAAKATRDGSALLYQPLSWLLLLAICRQRPGKYAESTASNSSSIVRLWSRGVFSFCFFKSSKYKKNPYLSCCVNLSLATARIRRSIFGCIIGLVPHQQILIDNRMIDLRETRDQDVGQNWNFRMRRAPRLAAHACGFTGSRTQSQRTRSATSSKASKA
jgi:hypothetical protein